MAIAVIRLGSPLPSNDGLRSGTVRQPQRSSTSG